MARIYHRGEEKRQALEMRYEHGMSYGDIAKATGIPVSTIKSWVRRGKKIEECLRQEAGGGYQARALVKPTKVEVTAQRSENVDRDARAEIRELQMQVALLRDFLSRKERGEIRKLPIRLFKNMRNCFV